MYEALTKGGHPVCRCGFDDQRNDRSLEVPAWMFEAAACDHLRVVDTPFVDSQAVLRHNAIGRPHRLILSLNTRQDPTC